MLASACATLAGSSTLFRLSVASNLNHREKTNHLARLLSESASSNHIISQRINLHHPINLVMQTNQKYLADVNNAANIRVHNMVVMDLSHLNFITVASPPRYIFDEIWLT